MLVGSTAAAAPAVDTVTLDGQFELGPIAPMVEGSIHYEHRFADSSVGLTVRGMGGVGAYLDDSATTFSSWSGLVGIRKHGELHGYGELEVGVIGLRNDRSIGDELEHYGVEWHVLPAAQGTLGVRFGPVDFGFVVQVPTVGIGLHLGIAIDG